MLNDLQRHELAKLLRQSNSNDAWSLDRIALHFGMQLTHREKEMLRKEVKNIPNRYADIKGIANIGKGYFYPRSPLDIQKVIDFYESRRNGLIKRMNYFAAKANELERSEAGL
ncbi:hypothetical protein ABHN11_24685 [Brevibacillus centrosporus]|uniref:hypothetical protein n=1 Tax=Brevibacillus centrosporus TaxID=54910 RepID=UPI003D2600A0